MTKDDSKGWIKLHRKILDHPRYAKGDGEWLLVWTTILLSATHSPVKRLFAGAEIVLKPGQLITSRDSLGRKTGIHPSTVERKLQLLEIELQIERQSDNKSTLITVVNWDLYQNTEQENESPPNNNRTTTEQQPNTHKNGKELEELKNYKEVVGELFPAIPVQPNGNHTPKGPQKVVPTSEEIILKYSKDPTYEGIDVARQYGRMVNWCRTNKKNPSEKRFVNWLNRCDQPISETPRKDNPNEKW